jgi:hypothetical protein
MCFMLFYFIFAPKPELDPSAFLAVADITEVRGGRFKKRDIH